MTALSIAGWRLKKSDPEIGPQTLQVFARRRMGSNEKRNEPTEGLQKWSKYYK